MRYRTMNIEKNENKKLRHHYICKTGSGTTWSTRYDYLINTNNECTQAYCSDHRYGSIFIVWFYLRKHNNANTGFIWWFWILHVAFSIEPFVALKTHYKTVCRIERWAFCEPTAAMSESELITFEKSIDSNLCMCTAFANEIDNSMQTHKNHFFPLQIRFVCCMFITSLFSVRSLKMCVCACVCFSALFFYWHRNVKAKMSSFEK